MKYLEVTFTLSPDTQDARDLLAALATGAGFESFEETDDHLTGYVQTDIYNKVELDACISTFPIPAVSIAYEAKEAEDKDWNETWEQAGFQPIDVGTACTIYDAKKPLADHDRVAGRLYVAIDAQQAFGTGTHETTQMIVATLLQTTLEGKRLLDCGCGTGILGIVAAKCGAKEVVAYDIDDWSVKNTRHNAELNEVDIEVLEGNKTILSHVSGTFDVLVANINRNVLIDDLETFTEVMTHDGTIIMSGFYEDDAALIVDHAAKLGLCETDRKTSNGWCCLALKRTNAAGA